MLRRPSSLSRWRITRAGHHLDVLDAGGSSVLHVLDPGFPVASHRLGQQQVAEHRVLVEHVVAQQDPSPEIHPADGGVAECDDLGGAMEEHLSRCVGDGEQPAPLGRLVDGHRHGFPEADVGVVAPKLELHGVVDGGHEAGDDVASPAEAADDGDLLVAEGGDARVWQPPERGAPCRRSSP
ncbi:hypothetical protein OsI_14733 [Oryza sativa Indica Group]|uniref:Uncharacterized protein n=1 Tax=Oryza sativa subsp. indica TaxID=39946 RepID=A2XQ26_ORYSI|nr:hypothetical protein OsI_14733 [Oryza sativa Indica Group]